MSTTQLALGSGAMVLVGQLALSTFLPVPQPITVHSLTYSDGVVHQDRTVIALEGNDDRGLPHKFPAEWRAAIYDQSTGKPVPECMGTGFWNYDAGTRVANIPLPEWVGSDDCTRGFLEARGGQYYPVASWHWGPESTIKIGEVFRP